MNWPAPWPSRDECLAAMREGTGMGARVAVLDTGVDAEHEAFGGFPIHGFWEVRAGEEGIVINETQSGDPVGHGTAIAGIIRHQAPLAEIISIRVLDASSRQQRHEVIRAGAMLAIRMNASILNCSFGVPGTAFTLPAHLAWTDSAFHASRIVVAASSNHSVDAPEWPSHLASVIGVAAADCDPGELFLQPGHPVSIVAPGVSIPVPVPGGGSHRVTGSSFATAHVTGILARLISQFPGLSPSMAREALHQAAEGFDASTVR